MEVEKDFLVNLEKVLAECRKPPQPTYTETCSLFFVSVMATISYLVFAMFTNLSGYWKKIKNKEQRKKKAKNIKMSKAHFEQALEKMISVKLDPEMKVITHSVRRYTGGHVSPLLNLRLSLQRMQYKEIEPLLEEMKKLKSIETKIDLGVIKIKAFREHYDGGWMDWQ